MSKLAYDGIRRSIPSAEVLARLGQILVNEGCPQHTASEVATHLVDASLSGVESHGVMRILQYVEQYRSGSLAATARPVFRQCENGSYEIDAQNGIGIPAMTMAVNHGTELALRSGISAIAVRHCGHTGRLGAFAEQAAQAGCMTIMIGGGNRKIWRQVAPHGGRKALLPTNPYCIGIPGGDQGPVILDFATSRIAGGWIYAARSAGAALPEDAVIDANGEPTTNPEDYFNGGAILPAGGAKGYALALVAELIGEAMLGPATTEINWLVITLNTALYQQPTKMQSIAEEILAEIRQCPPAPGFDKVEVPGERERRHHRLSANTVEIPEATWDQILAL